ncbi:hypothetical protein GYMLUDRAFT_33783 [Collybiopsis luxurians FD-317 M1]|nr:hypothetical protein GYMLUDRAFT_33783 [Collybiopsis luxurians FD-317 M1]
MSAFLAVAWIFALSWSPVRCDPNLNVPACSSQFNYGWSVNSKNQSPCQVAGYLASVCTSDNSWTIPSIVPSQFYELPQSQAVNCTCSSVYYSTLSACAACQGGIVQPWGTWATNCTPSVFDGFYPYPIPPGTAVPHWAYQLYTNNDTFNATVAQLLGDSPESSSTSGPTNTQSSPSSATGSSSSSDGKGKSEAGAIAGGVVGGLAFLVIVAIIILLYLRQKRRKAAAKRDRPSIDDDTALTTPTPFLINPRSPSPPMRVYNPSDPSTYPATPSTYRTQSPETLASPTSHYRSLSDATNYTGVAEV